MSKAKIDALTKDNYDTWVIQAEAVLVRQKLWKYIEKPLTTTATADDVENDRLAKSELILIIAPSELKQIKNCSTAKDVWDKLKNTYASKGPARKASLLKLLILTKLEGNDVRSHLNKFMDTVDKLADMDVTIKDDLLTIMMLYSLSPEYENFRVAIESRDNLPKPEELKTKIFEEFEARHNQNMTNIDEPESSYQEETLYASCRICKRRGNIFKRKNHKICTHCWKKNNERPKKQNTDSHRNNYATQCLLTRNKKPENSIWVLDSGCTSHMTYRRDLFKSIEKTSRKLNFATEDCTAEIQGKDSDYFGHTPLFNFTGDQTTGRSTSGIVCLYSGGAISWRSQKQTTVSISSTEAEIIAASEAAQEILWLNRLLSDLTKAEIPVLNLDNKSAVYLAHNPKYEYHKRTKHIKLKHFFVRECVSNGDFSVKQVSSENQLADMLTKPLFGPRILGLSSRMGLKNLS